MNRMRFLMPVWFWVVAAIFAAAVMLLWNWLMPAIFGLAVINYWQALGILALSRILFGGFGGGDKMMLGGMMHGMHGRNPIRDKWMKLSPEQQQEFIKKRMSHFGRGFHGGLNFDFEAGENTPKEQEKP